MEQFRELPHLRTQLDETKQLLSHLEETKDNLDPERYASVSQKYQTQIVEIEQAIKPLLNQAEEIRIDLENRSTLFVNQLKITSDPSEIAKLEEKIKLLKEQIDELSSITTGVPSQNKNRFYSIGRKKLIVVASGLISLIVLLLAWIFLVLYNINVNQNNAGSTISHNWGPDLYDIDGNRYRTFRYGGQVWMAENLRTSKYSDGTPILYNYYVRENIDGQEPGSYWHYDNQHSNEGKYGKLYNWYAVANRRNLCPKGWHVPSDMEWTYLEYLLSYKAGEGLKSTSGWSDNGNGTNISGFTGLPGGQRNFDNTYLGIGEEGYFWTSNEFDPDYAMYRYLTTEGHDLYGFFGGKSLGLSVRCVQN